MLTMANIPSLTRKELRAYFVQLVLIACLLGGSGESFAQADWKKEWDKTLEAAKKEGK